MINHRICECIKFAQKEYKTRHELLGKVIHWELCKNLKVDHTDKCYIHNQEAVQENEVHNLFWDFEKPKEPPNLGQMTRPYNDHKKKKKKRRICRIVNFALPANRRVKLREKEKTDKYQNLARSLKKTAEHGSYGDPNYNWCY